MPQDFLADTSEPKACWVIKYSKDREREKERERERERGDSVEGRVLRGEMKCVWCVCVLGGWQDFNVRTLWPPPYGFGGPVDLTWTTARSRTTLSHRTWLYCGAHCSWSGCRHVIVYENISTLLIQFCCGLLWLQREAGEICLIRSRSLTGGELRDHFFNNWD